MITYVSFSQRKLFFVGRSSLSIKAAVWPAIKNIVFREQSNRLRSKYCSFWRWWESAQSIEKRFDGQRSIGMSFVLLNRRRSGNGKINQWCLDPVLLSWVPWLSACALVVITVVVRLAKRRLVSSAPSYERRRNHRRRLGERKRAQFPPYLCDLIGNFFYLGIRLCLCLFEDVLEERERSFRHGSIAPTNHFQSICFVVELIDSFACRFENLLLTKIQIFL